MTQPTIIWDFDGTLAYREGMFSQTLLDILDKNITEHGVCLADIRPYLKTGFPWHEPNQPHLHLDSADKWWEKLEAVFAKAFRGVGVEASLVKAYAKEARMHYINPEGFQLYEDTIPVLSSLKQQGWQNIILSNHVPELEQIVTFLGLAPYISKCISSANIGYEKPHPQAFAIALSEAGHPSQVFMVGDSLTADVQGAQSVGIKAILVRKPKPAMDICYAPTLRDVVPLIIGE